jgi:hypothetical protein
MNKHDLFIVFKMDPEIYFRFINRVQDYYNPCFIEYHNKTHGADVCQTMYFFLEGCGLKMVGAVSDLELGAILIATACHDFEHFGYNNPFVIESRLPWAVQYNDRSPLENHHVAATFSIMEKEGFNIFSKLNSDDFKTVRKMMIELILATDASLHFGDLAKLKSRIASEDFAADGDDKLNVLKMAVHLSDISNPAKSFKIALVWTGLLYDEFFKQGDKEVQEGRPPSFLMDRKTTNIAGCSIGFMNMLVVPAYEELAKIIPNASVCLDNLNINRDKWEELKEEFKDRMENGQNYITESSGVIKELHRDASLLSTKEGSIKKIDPWNIKTQPTIPE